MSDTEDFALTPPEAVAAITVEKAQGKVTLSDAEKAPLDGIVTDFVNLVVQNDIHDPIFKDAVNRIHNMGVTDIQRAAAVSNRMLERPVGSLKKGVVDPASDVGSSLIELRRTVEDLDPSKQGDLFSARKILGLIPFGNKLAAYFARYESSQAHINAIILGLKRGQDELRRDNSALEVEKTNLWNLMKQLEKYILIGQKLEAALSERAKMLELSDPDKAKLINDEMVFYTRQKVIDLLTQQSVNIQSYLAFDIIRKNNLELIKGVDRATTTTVSALRTAVIVAQAMANAKLVLSQIQALNETTGTIIEGTARMLAQDTAAIHQQAASSTIPLEKLQSAFTHIYQSLDAIDTFKSKALDSMAQTVNVLQEGVTKSQSYLDRVRLQAVAEVQSTDLAQVKL